jgi:hypothetical protein
MTFRVKNEYSLKQHSTHDVGNRHLIGFLCDNKEFLNTDYINFSRKNEAPFPPCVSWLRLFVRMEELESHEQIFMKILYRGL